MLDFLGDRVPRISVQDFGRWHDDVHGLSDLIHADPADFCRRLAKSLPDRPVDGDWRARLLAADRRYWQAVEEMGADREFEGLILADITAALPDGAHLFVANSLPVRHLDEFVRPAARRVGVFASRGASGIDGTISTALGAAAVVEGPLVLVVGDLAFYHDLNGLLAMNRLGLRTTIVLIHNDGGGIFRRLPVADHDDAFLNLFLTPHGLAFEPAARLFGLSFERAAGRADLREALRRSIGARDPHVIEIRTDSAAHEEFRRAIIARFAGIDEGN
jgi:2-succinyl-5-enolpyruvyl-6-hydroxy-3-cyclohexene-1-carboxylate synthase